MASSQKAVSSLIAAVLLVAFVIAVAIIVTNSFTNVIKLQTGTVETVNKAWVRAL